MISLCPDYYLADNLYKELLLKAASGKRLIFVPHLRLNKSQFEQQVKSSDTLKTQQLVDVAVNSIHAWASDSRAKRKQMYYKMYWRLSPYYYMYKHLHIQPLYIDAKRQVQPLLATIDASEYHIDACPDPKETAILRYDKSILFEISDASHDNHPYRRASMLSLAFQMKENAHPRHLQQFFSITGYLIHSKHKVHAKYLFNKARIHWYLIRLHWLVKMPHTLFKILFYLKEPRNQYLHEKYRFSGQKWYKIIFRFLNAIASSLDV